MQFIKRILLLRKQRDDVKLMFIFSIVGIITGCFIISHIRQYIYTLRGEAEYIAIDSSGTVTDTKLASLLDIDNIVCVSRNLEQMITFRNQKQEISMECTLLEESYVSEVYHIEQSTAMQTFYANRVAYEQIIQPLMLAEHEKTNREITLSFIQALPYDKGKSDEANFTGADSEIKTAKIVCVDVLNCEEPFLFCIGKPLQLKKNANKIRILYANQSESHNLTGQLNRLSMSLQNTVNVMQREWNIATLILKIRYECSIFILTIILELILLHCQRQNYS